MNKSQLRAQLKTLRDQLSAIQCKALNRRILINLANLEEFKSAQRIFCYLSFGSEVDTRPLVTDLLGANKVLAVPRITQSGMQAVRLLKWDELKPSAMGILEPIHDAQIVEQPDLVITPGLGFSHTGYRLGYGKAYYDNWFHNNPHGTRIGLGFGTQMVTDLMNDPWDIPMHIIVTEDQVFRF